MEGSDINPVVDYRLSLGSRVARVWGGILTLAVLSIMVPHLLHGYATSTDQMFSVLAFFWGRMVYSFTRRWPVVIRERNRTFHRMAFAAFILSLVLICNLPETAEPRPTLAAICLGAHVLAQVFLFLAYWGQPYKPVTKEDGCFVRLVG